MCPSTTLRNVARSGKECFIAAQRAVPVFNTAIFSPGVSHGGLKVKALVQLVTAENFGEACF